MRTGSCRRSLTNVPQCRIEQPGQRDPVLWPGRAGVALQTPPVPDHSSSLAFFTLSCRQSMAILPRCSCSVQVVVPLTTASYSWFVVAHQFPSVPDKLGALVAPQRLPHRRLTIWHVGVPPGPVQSVIPCSAMDGDQLGWRHGYYTPSGRHASIAFLTSCKPSERFLLSRRSSYPGNSQLQWGG